MTFGRKTCIALISLFTIASAASNRDVILDRYCDEFLQAMLGPQTSDSFCNPSGNCEGLWWVDDSQTQILQTEDLPDGEDKTPVFCEAAISGLTAILFPPQKSIIPEHELGWDPIWSLDNVLRQVPTTHAPNAESLTLSTPVLPFPEFPSLGFILGPTTSASSSTVHHDSVSVDESQHPDHDDHVYEMTSTAAPGGWGTYGTPPPVSHNEEGFETESVEQEEMIHPQLDSLIKLAEDEIIPSIDMFPAFIDSQSELIKLQSIMDEMRDIMANLAEEGTARKVPFALESKWSTCASLMVGKFVNLPRSEEYLKVFVDTHLSFLNEFRRFFGIPENDFRPDHGPVVTNPVFSVEIDILGRVIMPELATDNLLVSNIIESRVSRFIDLFAQHVLNDGDMADDDVEFKQALTRRVCSEYSEQILRKFARSDFYKTRMIQIMHHCIN